MDKKIADGILKKYVEGIFVDPKKKADMTASNNIAALITAATKMAENSSGIASPDTTTTQLLDLYHKQDDKKINDLLGMSPYYIKNNIGFTLEDGALAKANYDARKGTYDELYTILSMREKSYEKTKNKTI